MLYLVLLLYNNAGAIPSEEGEVEMRANGGWRRPSSIVLYIVLAVMHGCTGVRVRFLDVPRRIYLQERELHRMNMWVLVEETAEVGAVPENPLFLEVWAKWDEEAPERIPFGANQIDLPLPRRISLTFGFDQPGSLLLTALVKHTDAGQGMQVGELARTDQHIMAVPLPSPHKVQLVAARARHKQYFRVLDSASEEATSLAAAAVDMYAGIYTCKHARMSMCARVHVLVCFCVCLFEHACMHVSLHAGLHSCVRRYMHAHIQTDR